MIYETCACVSSLLLFCSNDWQQQQQQPQPCGYLLVKNSFVCCFHFALAGCRRRPVDRFKRKAQVILDLGKFNAL